MFNSFVFVVMYPPKSGGKRGIPKGTIESANRADLMLHISQLPRAKNKFQVTVIKAKDLPSSGLNFKFKTDVHNGFAALVPNDDIEDEGILPNKRQGAEEEQLSDTQKYLLDSINLYTRAKSVVDRKTLEADYLTKMGVVKDTDATEKDRDALRKKFERAIEHLINIGHIIKCGKAKNTHYKLIKKDSVVCMQEGQQNQFASSRPTPPEVVFKGIVIPPLPHRT